MKKKKLIKSENSIKEISMELPKKVELLCDKIAKAKQEMYNTIGVSLK